MQDSEQGQLASDEKGQRKIARIQRYISLGLFAAAVICLSMAIYYYTKFLTFPKITTYNLPELNLYASLEPTAQAYLYTFVGLAISGSIVRVLNFGKILFPKVSIVGRFDPRLSGLRGLAALGVVFLHSGFPLPYLSVISVLYVGVPVFLMLSMYLLLNSLQFNGSLSHYFKRRLTRIYPIYFGAIIATCLVFKQPIASAWQYLVFAQYFLHASDPVPPTYLGSLLRVFWTLQLEEAAYLFIPIISRLSLTNKLKVGYSLVGIGIVALFTSPIWIGFNSVDFLQTLIPVAVASYGFGILVFCRKINRLFVVANIGILGLIVLNFVAPYEYAGYVNGTLVQAVHYLFFIQAILYTISLIGLASILTHPPAFLARFLILGEESYALYAIHVIFITLFGFIGIILALVSAFGIEFALRHKEITKRIRGNYNSVPRLRDVVRV